MESKLRGICVESFGNRLIAISGIGRLFFQEGFPISMAISELSARGIEVSMFHVADECLKNGWSAKTTYNKLIADFEDDIDHNNVDKEQLRQFCFCGYEDQREMIFQYLFSTSSHEAIAKKKAKVPTPELDRFAIGSC